MFRVASRFEIIGVDHVGIQFRQREPSVAEAEARWLTHQAIAMIHRKWARTWARPSWRMRLTANREYLGRFTYYMCRDAEAALAVGEYASALRLLGYSLRVSPVHTLLRSWAFWTVLRSAALWHVSRRLVRGAN